MSQPSPPHEVPVAKEQNSQHSSSFESARFLRLLSHTRFVILFGAFASLLASIVLLVQSTLTVIQISWEAVTNGDIGHDAVEHLTIEFLAMIDSILLGTVLYIIALGLYELFFEPDLPLPEWLRFRELTQLKESLIEVIVVLLGVLFVGKAVAWVEGDEIINYGIATATVILAFGLILGIGHLRRQRGSDTT